MSTRKPGRDADAAREAILGAAEGVFAEHGFAGARIDNIATSAGYNKSLIFHYFGDKLELYRAVVARLKGEMQGQLSDVVAPYMELDGEPTAAQVRDLTEGTVRLLFDYYRSHPRMLRILCWEAAEGWVTFTRMGLEHDNAEWAVAPGGFLQRARTAGVLRADVDPVLLIANILGMTQIYLASIPQYRELFPDAALDTDAALDMAREQIVGLILHGALSAG
ncbi:MAG: TetR family transcriptional regulator [Chloroflexales bacterium]|nr:TetR family transcriptional regulator [Chloroflexales bacterium]